MRSIKSENLLKNKGKWVEAGTKKSRAIDKRLNTKMYGSVACLMTAVLRSVKLRKTWVLNGIESHPYEAMILANIPLAENKSLSLNNKITPDGKFIELQSAYYKTGELMLEFNFGKDCEIRLPIKVYVYIVFRRQQIIIPGWVFINDPHYGYRAAIKIPDDVRRSYFKKEPDPYVYIAGTGLDIKRKFTWTSTAAVEAGPAPENSKEQD